MSSPVITDSSELAAANQHSLRRLILSVRASVHKLNLLIAICDNPFYRDELIRTYEAELTQNSIACYQVTLDRQQPSLKQTLLDWQAQTPDWHPETPTVVTVRGGDELLGVRLQQPKSAQERFFFSVQWTREGLRDFQLPIVLWVTEAVAQGLAQQAPDFWSWRGGVFEFVQPMAWQPPDLQRWLTQPQTESTETAETLADPAAIEQQIATLQADYPNSPLLESLYQSLGETYFNRLQQGKAIDYPQETAKAIAAFQAAISRREPLPDLTPLANSLNYLGLLYKSQGRYAEAESLYMRSLQIYEQQLGEDHPYVATSLNNLAGLYELQGRYAEAEPLYVRALQISEQQLGADHPDTAASLNNLAGLYKSQGLTTEAEPLYVRALQISEQELGADHPATATSLNNLAELYRVQGRTTEAEPLYVRALQIREQQLGADHPDVAQSLNNLALLYQSQGRYAETEPLFVRSLQIREQQLGADHPNTANGLNNLALLYESQGRYAEAEPLYVRALQIREQELGADHPATAISLWSLAALYYNMSRIAEAKPLITRAVAIFERTLGEQHPHTHSAREWWRRIHNGEWGVGSRE
ncbi:tetratricopeptide repeat protein [Stenomitos frigidus]|nr:tetratricopeptide repeat protein [Stenomitos frigidus]